MVEEKVHEQIVISSVLMNNSLRDELKIEPGQFSDGKLRAAYGAICGLIDSGLKADIVSVGDKLHDYAWVATLTDAAGDPWYSAKAMREAWQKMSLRRLSKMIAEGLTDKTAAEVVEMIDKEVRGIEDGGESQIVSLSVTVSVAVEQIEARYFGKKNGGSGLSGLTTGYPSIDKLIGGFQRGEFTVVAARTGMGKSELIKSMMLKQGQKGIAFGLFSLEMPKEQIAQKAISATTGIEYQRLRDGALSDGSDFSRLADGAGHVGEMRGWINDTGGIHLGTLRAGARRMVRMGAQIIYVDHIGLVRYPDEKMSKVERTGEVSNGLQILARELGVPIVGVAQLNRQAEGKEPSLSDLRWAGDIEQDAATVIFLTGDRDKRERDAVVAKSRYGDVGRVSLTFLSNYGRYEELQR